MKATENANPARYIINGVEQDYEAGASVTDAKAADIIKREDFPPEAPAPDAPFNIEIPDPGTKVVANPTLAGTEDSLTGLEVDGTKYAVGGSSGGVLVVNVTKEARILTCGKTAGEIYEACPTVFFSVPDSDGFTVSVISYYEQTDDGYTFEAGNYVFEAETSADYPQFDMDK